MGKIKNLLLEKIDILYDELDSGKISKTTFKLKLKDLGLSDDSIQYYLCGYGYLLSDREKGFRK